MLDGMGSSVDIPDALIAARNTAGLFPCTVKNVNSYKADFRHVKSDAQGWTVNAGTPCTRCRVQPPSCLPHHLPCDVT